MSIGGINFEAEVLGRNENFPPGYMTSVFCQTCDHQFCVGESIRVFCGAVKGTPKKHCKGCVIRLKLPEASGLKAKVVYPDRILQADGPNGCA